MTVRRRRQHPSDFGRASTFVETIELPEIEEPSCRFLAAIGYYGLVELEYKRDPRDGVCKLLDVNARTWGYHSLGGPPASTSLTCCSATRSARRWRRRTPGPVSAGSG